MTFDDVNLPGELDDEELEALSGIFGSAIDEEPSEYAEANFERTTWPDVEQDIPDIDDDGYSDEDKYTNANRPSRDDFHENR